MSGKAKDIAKYIKTAKAIQEALDSGTEYNTSVLGFIGACAWGRSLDLNKDKIKCQAFFQYLKKNGVVESGLNNQGEFYVSVNPKYLKNEVEVAEEIKSQKRDEEIKNAKFETEEDYIQFLLAKTDDREIVDIIKRTIGQFTVYKNMYEREKAKSESYEKVLGTEVAKIDLQIGDNSLQLSNITLMKLANIAGNLK